MYFINKQTGKIHPFLTINVIVTNQQWLINRK